MKGEKEPGREEKGEGEEESREEIKRGEGDEDLLSPYGEPLVLGYFIFQVGGIASYCLSL